MSWLGKPRWRAAAAVAAVLIPFHGRAAGRTIGGLTFVPQGPRGAACLDGTPPGYWIEKGRSSLSWVIHAEGGSWCWDATSCAKRALKTRHGIGTGSSKGYGPTTSCYGDCNGILSRNCAENPTFCDYNHVWIGYCDGSSFSSNRDAPYRGLHYRGRPNLDAVLDSLIGEHGLGGAGSVVFTGGSAGGTTVYLQLDHVRSRLPDVPVVKGLADGGFFLDVQKFFDGASNVIRAGFQSAFELWNSSAGVNDACIAANPGTTSWKCLVAPHTFAHIASPIFIAEGMYDPLQLGIFSQQLPCTDCTPKPGGPRAADCCGNATLSRAFLAFGGRRSQLRSPPSATGPPARSSRPALSTARRCTTAGAQCGTGGRSPRASPASTSTRFFSRTAAPPSASTAWSIQRTPRAPTLHGDRGEGPGPNLCFTPQLAPAGAHLLKFWGHAL